MDKLKSMSVKYRKENSNKNKLQRRYSHSMPNNINTLPNKNNDEIDETIKINIIENDDDDERIILNSNAEMDELYTNLNDKVINNNIDKINNNNNNCNENRTVNYLKSYFASMLEPSDNKLAMKLFGSKKGVLKEKLRQQKVSNWVIHPCSDFRFYWDLIMLILLIANVIILPVAISFFNDNWSHTGLLTFNLISDSLFLFDILVNFRTGVLRNDYIDEIILEPKEIAKNYLKTWFFVDIVSSIPLDYIFLLIKQSGEKYQLVRTGRALKVLRLVKLLSLLRLLRLSRLVRYIHQWEEVSCNFFSLIFL